MTNVALLQRTLEMIELNPERWDQDHWVSTTECGTTYCLAGWAYVLATGVEFDELHEPEGIFEQAQAALGLTEQQAYDLFHFVSVFNDGPGEEEMREPTFSELVDRVQRVTGYRYQPPLTTQWTVEEASLPELAPV